MANYIAVVHKDPKSDFGVSFPDFPGCITAGSTIDEAKDMANDALSLHIQGMLEDAENIPAPSKLEEIMDDPDYSDAIAILVVSVAESKPRSIRVNITVPEDMLRRIDNVEKKEESRFFSFNEAALAAIRDAAPFPPFPEGAVETPVEVKLPMVFELND